jgi:hypothetical protein
MNLPLGGEEIKLENDSCGYEPVSKIKFLVSILLGLSAGVKFRNRTFIDVGCGLDYLIFLGKAFPKSKWVGIESDQALHDRAVKTFSGSPNVQIQCTSAQDADYSEIFEPVFFLFNPFSGDTFVKFQSKLGDDCNSGYLIYINDLSSALLSDQTFQLLKRSKIFRISVYKIGVY